MNYSPTEKHTMTDTITHKQTMKLLTTTTKGAPNEKAKSTERRGRITAPS
jgi:hypothetical protein